MACLGSGILVPWASVLSLGPLVCDQRLALADGGFLLETRPAPGLVALTLKHCCLQKTVHYSSRVLAVLQSLHSWEVSVFPGR